MSQEIVGRGDTSFMAIGMTVSGWGLATSRREVAVRIKAGGFASKDLTS